MHVFLDDFEICNLPNSGRRHENEIYRCNKVKYKEEQCKAGVYLNYPSTNNQVILYRSQHAHNCHEIATKVKSSMGDEVKAEIKVLFDFDSKIKPNKIIEIPTNKWPYQRRRT
jgi:hypothetical protein